MGDRHHQCFRQLGVLPVGRVIVKTLGTRQKDLNAYIPLIREKLRMRNHFGRMTLLTITFAWAGLRAREVSVRVPPSKCTYRVERPHKLSTKEIFLGTVGNIICISTIASSQFLQITQPCWGGGKRGTRASAPCWSGRCHLRVRPSLDSRRRRRGPLHCMRTHARASFQERERFFKPKPNDGLSPGVEELEAASWL